jgi:hypothetical protein
MYLRDVGTITDEQADEILAASAPNRIRRSGADRSVLLHNWMVQGALFTAILGGGGAIQAMSGRLAGDPDQFAAESGAPVVPSRAGYLQFVVDPWAEVHIDGQLVLTTPSAQRIALPPGRHFLRLYNPYFESVDREVWVRENDLEVIHVALEETVEGTIAPATGVEEAPAAAPASGDRGR